MCVSLGNEKLGNTAESRKQKLGNTAESRKQKLGNTARNPTSKETVKPGNETR